MTEKQEEQLRKELGRRLRQTRRKLNLTREFVAEQLGCSDRMISFWETGARDIRFLDLVRLGELYGCSWLEWVPEELLVIQ